MFCFKLLDDCITFISFHFPFLTTSAFNCQNFKDSTIQGAYDLLDYKFQFPHLDETKHLAFTASQTPVKIFLKQKIRIFSNKDIFSVNIHSINIFFKFYFSLSMEKEISFYFSFSNRKLQLEK